MDNLPENATESNDYRPFPDDIIPDPFVRKLTKEDCKRGFHNFKPVGETPSMLYEKCVVCGKTAEYHKMALHTKEVKNMWQKNHKIDMLQPYGRTLKDFIYYYGDIYD